MRTVIPGEENAAFSAGIEQPFAFLVLTHRMNESIGGKTARDAGPGLAEIRGLEDVRSKVIHLVPLDGNISRAGVVHESFNHAHGAPFGRAFWRYVGPVLSSVGRHMHQPVVRARPD